MSNVTLWARPTWNTDRWVRDFFGPAAAGDWFKGFRPAAEIAKDGDDAVVRVELPGVDVEKDVNVEVDKGQLVIHGERRDERTIEDTAKGVRHFSEVRYGSFRRTFRLIIPVAPSQTPIRDWLTATDRCRHCLAAQTTDRRR
jgi:HSP20 family molecular chaperone IbpA